MLEAVRIAAKSTPQLWRPRSLTLIEPAVSRWCLSEKVVSPVPGIYCRIPEAVVFPVLILYSSEDWPLRAMSAFLAGSEDKKEVQRGADKEADREALGATGHGAALGAHGRRP